MEKVEPKIELVHYTQDALNILIYTKSGRLEPGTTFEDIKNMPTDEKHDHLEYMLDTIKSSFEFVDYIFKIENVSRAFTHQLVRTRPNSYQQQAMRVVDARDFSYLISTDHPAYIEAFEFSKKKYAEMIDAGVAVQDARGVLGTGIHTEIFVKGNLRSFSDMAELRLCKRAEGEYQKVFKMIIDKIIEIHPWAKTLLEVYCVKYGICAFPRYDKCPIQKYCFKPETIRERIRLEWGQCRHIAAPKSINGMTM